MRHQSSRKWGEGWRHQCDLSPYRHLCLSFHCSVLPSTSLVECCCVVGNNSSSNLWHPLLDTFTTIALANEKQISNKRAKFCRMSDLNLNLLTYCRYIPIPEPTNQTSEHLPLNPNHGFEKMHAGKMRTPRGPPH